MNWAVNRKVVRITLTSKWSLSLAGGKDFSVRLALLVHALLFVLLGQAVHPLSGICRPHRRLGDLVELGDHLRVLGDKLLRGPFIFATLFEGYSDPIFAHVRDGVADLAKPADVILEELIGLLDAIEQIVLMPSRVIVRCMEVGFKQLAQMFLGLDRALRQIQQPCLGRPLENSH